MMKVPVPVLFLTYPVRRFLTKVFLAALPFLVVACIECFVLPIDYFTFRVWEALKVTSAARILLPGPFYPRMNISKMEMGDLAPYTGDAVIRPVIWQTDRFGYRKRDDRPGTYPVVVVGDSCTAGSGLSQDDILSEVLEGMLGLGVYPFAPASMRDFLQEKRFSDHPPKVVVLASIEREIPNIQEVVSLSAAATLRRQIWQRLWQSEATQFVAVYLDRALKGTAWRYGKSRLRRAGATLGNGRTAQRRMLFLQGEAAIRPVSEETLESCVRTLKGIKDVLAARGVRFVFLPIPNKENIYYRLIPAMEQPTFLTRLIRALRAEGVDTIDTQNAFNKASITDGVTLYQSDDSHWNGAAVRIAGRLLTEAIRSKDQP